MYVIGVDPGPLPGIVRLHLIVDSRGVEPSRLIGVEPSRLIGAEALQVTPGVLLTVATALCEGIGQALAYERFVVGRRAARSATAAAGTRTRSVIGALEEWGHTRCKVHARSAAEVKPWATDARLDAAGLLELTKGMRHARDAARHALFCAVRDYGLPDPLSRKANL
ncbi:hypothetical protein Q0Z83_060380 [Actinoplanes sichuanensis]|uniref:Uncharacterized protein n=1 Tax=Actinoplanes sichuanensis TaxID=512349 RepID=A0ABW4A6M1_9ACTN|nr:hypothetical protein [Actinoplanes sichuanensis]BEL07847.1 hypothetical protein Q0Z83_060380 [Actinoplanes sichuanensis]